MNPPPNSGRSSPRVQVSARRVDPQKSLRNHLIVCAAVAIGASALIYRLIPNDIVRTARRLTESEPAAPDASGRSIDPAAQAAEWGSLFTPEPPEPDRPPNLTAIPVPDFPGAMAIWGAVGRSSRGQIYFGVSAVDWKGAKKGETLKDLSAHLFEFDPVSRSVRDRGNAVEQLKRLGMHRPGEQQQKIHSKIVEGPDGALYFASGDEAGADFSGNPKNPTWPSHLWRINRGQSDWEHLISTPEHLIAVARGGDRIFALGWHGHVLYAFDTQSGKADRVRVGSLLGHISRNFVTDARGHVYVPRLKVDTDSGARMVSTLVEFDQDLKELGETVLDHYLGEGPGQSHGITGVQPLADGTIAFVTHAGFLYQIIPNLDKPSDVMKLGWFYPSGSGHYMASLFTYDGVRHLYGLTHDESGREWVTFDLKSRKSVAKAVPGKVPVMGLTDSSGEGPLSVLAEAALGSPYGCATRDDQGNFYFVGRIGYDPVVYQARRHDGSTLGSTAAADRRPEPGASATVKPSASEPASRPTRTAIVKAPEDSRTPRRDEPVPADPKTEAELERLRTDAQRRVTAKVPVPANESPAPAQARGADLAVPEADTFPPSSPSLEPGQPAAAGGMSKEDTIRAVEESWRKRGQFRKDLWAILDADGDQAGPAIEALCDRYGRDVPPEAKRAVGILAKTPVTRSDLTRRITIFRASGIPEPTLLDDIMRLEKTAIGSRGGPRNMDEARVRAARALLAVPLPKKN